MLGKNYSLYFIELAPTNRINSQVAAASIAVPMKTEKYYDLCGSLGFLSCTLISVYFPALRSKFLNGPKVPFPKLSELHPRQLFMSAVSSVLLRFVSTIQASRRTGNNYMGRTFRDFSVSGRTFALFWS